MREPTPAQRPQTPRFDRDLSLALDRLIALLDQAHPAGRPALRTMKRALEAGQPARAVRYA